MYPTVGSPLVLVSAPLNETPPSSTSLTVFRRAMISASAVESIPAASAIRTCAAVVAGAKGVFCAPSWLYRVVATKSAI